MKFIAGADRDTLIAYATKLETEATEHRTIRCQIDRELERARASVDFLTRKLGDAGRELEAVREDLATMKIANRILRESAERADRSIQAMTRGELFTPPRAKKR